MPSSNDMNKITGALLYESTFDLPDNIYLLTSLQSYFPSEKAAYPGTSLEIKSVNSPQQRVTSLSLNTQSEQSINQMPWLTTPKPESYSVINKPSLDFAFVTEFTTTLEKQLELAITRKLKNFGEVREIYINHNDELTTVKVILNIEYYDYYLMDKIFNEAEFPIRDSFKGELINFEYIPYYPDSEHLIDPKQDELIFDRAIQEYLPIKREVDSLEFNDYLPLAKPSEQQQHVWSIYP